MWHTVKYVADRDVWQVRAGDAVVLETRNVVHARQEANRKNLESYLA